MTTERATKKRGRPLFKPTAAQRRAVEQMVACGESQEIISRAIGCDPDTLRKHFPEELLSGHSRRRREVIELLFTNARGGNVSAQKKLEEITAAAGASSEFTEPKQPALGKKEVAAVEATVAGEGTDWGDDLRPPETLPN